MSKNEAIDLNEKFYIFDNFLTSNKHILERGEEEWDSSKIFFQLSIEHADNSPLTLEAKNFEKTNDLEFPYLKKAQRMKELTSNPLVELLHVEYDILGLKILYDGSILIYHENGLEVYDLDLSLINSYQTKQDSIIKDLTLIDNKIVFIEEFYNNQENETEYLQYLWNHKSSDIILEKKLSDDEYYEIDWEEPYKLLTFENGDEIDIIDGYNYSIDSLIIKNKNSEVIVRNKIEKETTLDGIFLELNDGSILGRGSYFETNLTVLDRSTLKTMGYIDPNIKNIEYFHKLKNGNVLVGNSSEIRILNISLNNLQKNKNRFYSNFLLLSNGYKITWKDYIMFDTDYQVFAWIGENQPTHVKSFAEKRCKSIIKIYDKYLFVYFKDEIILISQKNLEIVKIIKKRVHHNFRFNSNYIVCKDDEQLFYIDLKTFEIFDLVKLDFLIDIDGEFINFEVTDTNLVVFASSFKIFAIDILTKKIADLDINVKRTIHDFKIYKNRYLSLMGGRSLIVDLKTAKRITFSAHDSSTNIIEFIDNAIIEIFELQNATNIILSIDLEKEFKKNDDDLIHINPYLIKNNFINDYLYYSFENSWLGNKFYVYRNNIITIQTNRNSEKGNLVVIDSISLKEKTNSYLYKLKGLLENIKNHKFMKIYENILYFQEEDNFFYYIDLDRLETSRYYGDFGLIEIQDINKNNFVVKSKNYSFVLEYINKK